MKQLVDWIARFGRWFWKLWLLWGIGLSMAGALAVIWFWPDADVIRRVGLGFEVAGITTVMWGVYQTRAHFELPGIRENVGLWWRKFPPFKKRVIQGSFDVTITDSVMLDTGVVCMDLRSAASVEERLEALKKGVRCLEKKLSSAREELGQKIGDQAEKLEQEGQLRQQGDQKLKKLMVTNETGGLHLTALGLCWFLLGAILGGASTELARFGPSQPYARDPIRPEWMFRAGHISPAPPR